MPHTDTGYLQLRQITKNFRDVQVVKMMDLQAGAGEFIALVGASGCGKSTILRMIAGLESPTSGQIVIDGRDVTRATPADRDIAMVFQNYALYPHMDVAHNMSFALELSGVAKSEIATRVNAAAKVLDISHLLGRKPRELSGGQRQRVAMGRAIVREPKIFLFDEPLSNLDAKLRGQMRIEIALMHRRLGKTTVYVTHDQVEAMTLADRIVVMDQGEIQQIGSPDEVFNHPVNRFVAGFIGSPTMNFLEAKVRRHGEVLAFEGEGFRCVVAPQMRAHAAAWVDRDVAIGLRPQALQIGDAAGALQLQIRVAVCEYLGTESVLSGAVDSDRATPLTLTAPGNQTRLAGQTITVHAKPENLHAFEPGAHGVALRPPLEVFSAPHHTASPQPYARSASA